MRFEIVRDDTRKFKDVDIKIPSKSTKYSAGYDFYSNEDYILEPSKQHIFWTDVKCKVGKDEFLMIVPRSSIGIKYNLMLANTTGIIDHDYYNNIDNDGNIGICLYNYGNLNIEIKQGDRISQGIVMEYVYEPEYNVDFSPERLGGFGSTGN